MARVGGAIDGLQILRAAGTAVGEKVARANLCGADKLSRVAWLQSDPALSEVLGVE